MDDRQREPKDSDRSALAGRIKRASDAGRISGADRDIRLGNVWNAQSLTELDLMSRELDQLEAQPPPVAAVPATGERPWSTFEPGQVAEDEITDTVPGTPTTPAKTSSPARLALIVALVVLVAAIGIFVGLRGTDDPEPSVLAPGGEASDVPGTTPVPAGTKYSQSENGIRSFLQTYRQRFGTTSVVELTLYADYAIVNVPVPGKARQSGWLYRDGKWTEFGGVRAVFPGAQPVDTNQLAVPALVRNIAVARRTLNVEKPSAYVIVRWIKRADEAPSVHIHVANQFQESGYLSTTLDGRIERTYPYSP